MNGQFPECVGGEFRVMAQGRFDYTIPVMSMSTPQFGQMLTIMAEEGAIYVTRDQAKAFFGLEEPRDLHTAEAIDIDDEAIVDGFMSALAVICATPGLAVVPENWIDALAAWVDSKVDDESTSMEFINAALEVLK